MLSGLSPNHARSHCAHPVRFHARKREVIHRLTGPLRTFNVIRRLESYSPEVLSRAARKIQPHFAFRKAKCDRYIPLRCGPPAGLLNAPAQSYQPRSAGNVTLLSSIPLGCLPARGAPLKSMAAAEKRRDIQLIGSCVLCMNRRMKIAGNAGRILHRRCSRSRSLCRGTPARGRRTKELVIEDRGRDWD
jgi:hypothetical protein